LYIFKAYYQCPFLADSNATAIGGILSSVCDAVHSGSQGWCTGLKVVLACS